MDMKSDFFRSFRSYLFDFGGGLIWLAAFVVAFAAYVEPPDLTEILNYLLQVESSKSLKVLLITSGIILPFAVNIALKPFSLFAMNMLITVQRLVVAAVRQLAKMTAVARLIAFFSPYTDVLKSRITENKLMALQQKAHAQLVEHLGFGPKPHQEAGFDNRFSQESVLLFVKKENAALADTLDRCREDVWFRSSLVVPTSLIAASVVQFASQSCIWSVAVGLVSLIITFISAARAWRAWHEQLNAAVLILFRAR